MCVLCASSVRPSMAIYGCLWLSSVRPSVRPPWLSSVGEDGHAAIVIMDITTLYSSKVTPREKLEITNHFSVVKCRPKRRLEVTNLHDIIFQLCGGG